MASPKFPVAIIVFFILILTILTSTNITIGAAQVSQTISSGGVIQSAGDPTPSPSPTSAPMPSPTPATNLVSIPTSFESNTLGIQIGGSTGWSIGNSGTGIVYPASQNGYSNIIELEPNPWFEANSAIQLNELDSQFISLAGDTGQNITLIAYVSNTANTTRETAGAGPVGTVLDIDFWSSTGRICDTCVASGELTYPNYPQPLQIIPYGTTTPTKLEISFTLPATMEGDPWGTYAPVNGVPQYVTPHMMTIVLGTYSDAPSVEQALTYSYSVQLYITPP